MALALKKEALAVASGDAVYSYSYSGHVMKLTERPGQVTSLTVYKGRLLDAGNYKGVRDTMTGETMAGKDAKWRRIAGLKYRTLFDETEKEVLYGSMESEENFGIFELIDTEGRHDRHTPRYYRNGRTNLLYGWNILIDGGDYFHPPDKTPVTRIADSYSGDITLAYGTEGFPVTAFIGLGDREYCFANPKRIFDCRILYAQGKKKKLIFELKTSFDHELDELGEVVSRHDDISLRRFNAVFDALKRSFPEEFFIYDRESRKYKIHQDVYGNGDNSSFQRIAMLRNLERHIRENEGVSALALADRHLFAGCMNGKLIIPSNELQRSDAHIKYEFKYPVNALCGITEELMNNGLRQKITRNIAMKAVHARSRSAALRRVA